MQKKKWVRFGLTAAIVGGAIGGMSASGCSGDDNTSSPKPDSGTKTDSSIPSGDSGPGSDSSMPPGDSSTPTEGGTEGGTVANAKVYLLHAAVDPLSPPLRFCFGLGPNTDGGPVTVAGGIDPFPNYVTVPVPGAPAGLFPGFGGSTAGSPQLATFDLSTLTISLYAIDATQIATDNIDAGANQLPCEKLIGTDALGSASTAGGGTLKAGTQFWYLGTIPKGTLNHGETWVVAVTGCAAGEGSPNPATAESCPKGYAGTADYGMTAWQVDNTTAIAADGGIGAQFASASAAWDNVGAALGNTAGATAAGFWIEIPPVVSDAGSGGDAATDGGDGGVAEAGPPPGPTLDLIPITGTGSFGNLTPAKLVTVPVPLNSAAAGFFTSWVGADGGAIFTDGVPGEACLPGSTCISPYLLPLPDIDQITNGTVPAGGSFVDGKGYVFVLIGDPTNYPFINPLDGGPASPTTGVFNGKSAHYLGLPTSNP